jgi:hypothetical protein
MQRPIHDRAPMPYSEVLRVLGQYIDRHSLSEFRILETEGGVILQGLVTRGNQQGQRMTFEVTAEDVEDLYQDAYAERGKKLAS